MHSGKDSGEGHAAVTGKGLVLSEGMGWSQDTPSKGVGHPTACCHDADCGEEQADQGEAEESEYRFSSTEEKLTLAGKWHQLCCW
jgi:hypothetical protein